MTDLFPQLESALGERYTVLRELGRGGMAVVYAARDTKMDREVALKVLLPDLAVALGGERFQREIQIAAHLNHPHILGVYDSGEAGGLLYYVMPLVRGENIRKRLDREKQLPIDEALRISIEVASALDYAHRQGVVHRDIKPENILLEEGHAVVADFGIARAISNISDGRGLTMTGMSLGTASYMSPEQVAAEKDLDGRSDIYSLGCVTYEMLAGQPPFTGPNAAAIMARQALEMPPSLTVVRNTIPDEIEETVFQALAKSPVDRYATAQDYGDALQDCMLLAPTTTRRTMAPRMTETMKARQRVRKRRKFLIAGAIAVPVLVAVFASGKLFLNRNARPAAAVSGALDVKKVAVLYFDDLTGGKLGYLADGLTETLIEQLSQVQALRDVISKEGVGRFRGKNAPIDSIASSLQVGTIVKGSVAENGDRVGITIRVIDGNSGADQRQRGFEVPQSDPLALRTMVADSVASFLKDYLGEEIRVRELKLGTSNATAWTLVQRAEKLRKDALIAVAARDSATAARNFAQADSMLAEAEKQDARWASPSAFRSGIALARAQSWRSPIVAGPWIQEGLAHATKAIALDSTNADAWENRGRLRYLTWTSEIVTNAKDAQAALEGAEADLVKATENDKSRASAWNILSNVRSDRDDFTGAKLAAQRAWDEDAFQTNVEGVLWNLYRTSYNLEQAADASKWCKEGFSRFPRNRSFVRCRLWLRTMSAIPPNVDSAWTDSKTFVDLSPPAGVEFAKRESQILVGAALARAGKADSARKVLVRAREGVDEKIDPDHNLMGFEAFVRTLFNDPQDTAEAFGILRRYVSGNPAHREGLAKTQSWWWRPLIGDQRWKDLVAGR